jgi:NADH-quinone oxidoreductase subunit F
MSDYDLAPLREILTKLAPQGRTALLPALHAAQEIYGFLPGDVAEEVGNVLKVPLADLYGVIEFYGMFYSKPAGRKIIKVCTDPTCAMFGGEEILSSICTHLKIKPNTTSEDREFRIERATCLGLCDQAPAVHVNSKILVRANDFPVQQICNGIGPEPKGLVTGTIRNISAKCGEGYPVLLEDFVSNGGYSALKTALQLPPRDIIENVKSSGLVGRGGAAFPTGIKWESAANADGEPKFVVCNADESEPGTFKDRVLLEENPHLTIEGMLIAGYAIGASKGFLYIRGEYLDAYNVMRQALDDARKSGYLGENIIGAGFNFDVEIRLGAGAYICGEETALFESIEGKRGFPRIKPPFPTTHGLNNQPTVINNVETLCNIPLIIKEGFGKYRQIGTEQSPGTKLICLSGDVRFPGLYEVPFGVTLQDLIFKQAGGMRDEGSLQALLIGGAAGAFIPPDLIDTEITFEDLNRTGVALGSGAIIVLDSSRDIKDVLLRIGRFFAHESCGKCYPCQLGTQRQYEILERAVSRELLPGDVSCLSDIGWTMKDASICGLGQTAASAVLSAMEIWPDLFAE